MTGAEKLAEFLRTSGLTQLEFADLAKVPGPQVSMWLSRRRRPGLESAFKIEKATGGAVRAIDWITDAGRNTRRPRRSLRRKHGTRSGGRGRHVGTVNRAAQ